MFPAQSKRSSASGAASEVRRFFQAISDFSPRVHRSGVGETGTAALWRRLHSRPSTSFVADQPGDPLEVSGASDFDGVQRSLFVRATAGQHTAAPAAQWQLRVRIPFECTGRNRIFCRASYKDIYQRDGRMDR